MRNLAAARARRHVRPMSGFENHDAYLATLPPDQRAALEALRGQIAAAAPGAREVFSYGVRSKTG